MLVDPWLNDGDVRLYHGDSLEVAAALPDESVDCIVTSPPYWGLRDYGHDGQIGLESTPDEWVASLVAVFRECRRVLAPHGTFWLNVGDAYAANRSYQVPDSKHRDVGNHMAMRVPAASQGTKRPDGLIPAPASMGMKPKDMLGLPWMLAFALRADGWWLRSEIIWAKPNPMPESVTDRPTKAHEQVFLLTRSPRYWYDADAIREASDPKQAEHNQRYAREYAVHSDRAGSTGQPGNVNNIGIHGRQPVDGRRNARSVWSIATEPNPAAHFATYPTELVRRCLTAGCPERVCQECGRPSERIVEVEKVSTPTNATSYADAHVPDGRDALRASLNVTTLGWTDCGHGAYRPGVVLDPFMGSGTTAHVARRMGRHAVGAELNEAYLEIAARRLQQLSLLGDVA